MIKQTLFGTLANGQSVEMYSIINKNGARADILTYGATLQSLFMPDKNGNFEDVLIGFDDLEGHVERSDYQGQTVGRYANRLCGGRFKVGGKEYNVTRNENGINCLHGGAEFSHALWQAETDGENSVVLRLTSPDGSNGFPGEFTAEVRYTLDDENAIIIDYLADCTEASPINMTNHSYFNLGSFTRPDVLSQILCLRAGAYTPTDRTSIPTGEIRSVDGAAFDFREPKPIGRDIGADDEQLINCRGYDHNFCLDPGEGASASAYDPESGRYMEMFTDLPGVQLYTGNFLENIPGKGGTVMNRHAGFCLETQFYPDSPNHANFPSCIFKAGEKFKSQTKFKFSVK